MPSLKYSTLPRTGRRNFGEKMADVITEVVGTWQFLTIQFVLLIVWIMLNVVAWVSAWDPYPFIFLNLVLSFESAFTAPIIMMSQNRQNEIDRRQAENDYKVNLEAELEIRRLHDKIDLLKDQEIHELKEMVRQLSKSA